MLIPPTAFWEWIGCITGVVGSIMLATRHPKSAWAFVLYFVSSCSWIIYGVMTKAPGLIAMQLVFVVTAILGIYNWLILPRRRDKAPGIDGTVRLKAL